MAPEVNVIDALEVLNIVYSRRYYLIQSSSQNLQLDSHNLRSWVQRS